MVIYGKSLTSAYVKLEPKPVLNDNKWKVIKTILRQSFFIIRIVWSDRRHSEMSIDKITYK